MNALKIVTQEHAGEENLTLAADTQYNCKCINTWWFYVNSHSQTRGGIHEWGRNY